MAHTDSTVEWKKKVSELKSKEEKIAYIQGTFKIDPVKWDYDNNVNTVRDGIRDSRIAYLMGLRRDDITEASSAASNAKDPKVKAEKFEEAARYVGDTLPPHQLATRNLKELGRFYRNQATFLRFAADNWEKAGNAIDTKKDYEFAAELYCSLGWRSAESATAADIFEKLGNPNEALKNYEAAASYLKDYGKQFIVGLGGKQWMSSELSGKIKELKGRQEQSGLESSVASATTAAIGLIGGSFFLSSNVTGNVIGLSNTTSSWIGGILILIGLIALGFYVRNKMNRKKVVVQKVVSKPIKKKKK